MHPLHINQIEQHNGFMLDCEIQFTTPITVLVGKNGAGKTRFFQSLKNNKTKAQIAEKQLDPNTEIIVLTQEALTPQFETQHDADSLNQRISSAVRSYQSRKQLFDQPYIFDPNLLPRHEMEFKQLYPLVQLISKKTKKRPSELSEEDIKLHYTEVNINSLGSYNVAAIFNTYVKRIHDNEFNTWKNKEKGSDVPYYSNDEFERKFGPAPWIIINKILDGVFDGKFHFPQPANLNSITYDHQTPLLQNNDQPITREDLSSGEKTLLWLALSLFNTQYHDKEILSAPKLLLLDEPDAYLHPKMVQKMFSFLSEFNEHFGTRIILISHSPTTAALSPENSLFVVQPNKIAAISKDAAISELLDGVTQISINPENRRQVYVESHYDQQIFQLIFDHLKQKSSILDSSISVTFVSSGGKVPEEHLSSKAKSILGIQDDNKIREFIEAINGCGNCDQVYGTVESLTSSGATGVRGIVDWDLKNSSTEFVQVCGENYAYAIENLILDPISIILQLNINNCSKFPIEKFCGTNKPWAEWLDDKELLQVSMDTFLHKEMEINSEIKEKLCYLSGLTLMIDQEYLTMKGHDLEKKLLSQFPELRRVTNREGELKFKIVQNMINLTGGKLIPRTIEETMRALQS
jgi:ABC-type branched-subunit amino acid transport system ATPase component